MLINILLDEVAGINWFINIVVLLYFIFSWIFIFRKVMFRFVEISNLLLIATYQIYHFYNSVQNDLLVGNSTLEDFTNWMPLFVIYTYLTLGRKKGVLFSLIVLIIELVIGLQVFAKLSPFSLDSIVQFYIATIIYIVAFYYAQMAFGIYNELHTIKSNAFIDSLTGIPNRRKLSLIFDRFWKSAQEGKQLFSVIIIDIDNFKQINDKYGHDIGDFVLKEFSIIVNDIMTELEVFGRWGGEEFVILSQTTEKELVTLAELIQNTVANHNFKTVHSVTASFGVTTYAEGDLKEDIYKRADSALYQSKKNGKNQVSKYVQPLDVS